MADDKLKKQLDNLKDELDIIDQHIRSVASSIQTTLSTSLSKTVNTARNLADSLSKGKDITKQTTAAIIRTGQALENNELKSLRYQAILSGAIRNNNLALQNLINIKINELRIQRQILGNADFQLRKLLKIAENQNELNAQLQKTNSLLGASKKLAEDFIKPLKELFTFEGALKVIIESALNFNKISVDLGKNLAYGADNADRVTLDFVRIARYAGDVNITTKNLAEAFHQISDATGFVSEYSANTLKTQIMLTKQFGLTGDEASKIYEYSILTGKSSSQVNKNMVAAFVAARNQLGVGIPFKTTIAEASKISGQLAANLKNNPEFIVKAIAQAKALGTTLEQTKSQGEALLNFESSIENELKAELLTGKALNLERARAAALMGDQVTVAKELANQGMTLEKFQNMNVLAQQSFAAAIGLSSDQLANQLRMQKIAIESGKSLAQITEQEALEAQKRQNIQDKFAASVDKLKDLFSTLVAGPLGSFLNILTDSLDIITNTLAVMSTIWVLNKGIAAYSAMVATYQRIQNIQAAGHNVMLIARQALLRGELIKSIGIAAAAAFRNPFLAVTGLVAAAAVTYGINKAINNAQSVEDGIAPSSKGPFTITDSYGNMAFTKKGDNLAVSPNISNGSDNSGVIAAINELQKTLVSKNFSPVMKADGIVMATVTAQNSYNLA